MKLALSEILESAGKLKSKQERVDYLKKHDCRALQDIVQYAWHPEIKWDIPAGKPPYKQTEFLDQEGRLYQEMKKLALFVNNNGSNLNRVRLEQLYIQLLESVAPKDAKLLIGVKEGKLPRGITKAVVEETWPGLIPEKTDEEVSE